MGYCSAGNAMWKGDKVWKAVETNVASFDPSKVSVLLLGSVPFWQRIAGAHYKPERYSFFEDAKALLSAKQIRFAEMHEEVERIEYCDAEGHPSKAARWDLVPLLLVAFRKLLAG